MKSLLGRLSLRRAVGVYIGEDEITVSQVAATLFGPVEVCRQRESCRPEDLHAVLQRILEPLAAKRRNTRRPVAFGLPLLRVFFSTRPSRSANVEASPKALLHEVLRSPNANVDEMSIDMQQASTGKRPIVSLACCRKKYLSGLLATMEECGIRPSRVEPAACAVLRAAEQQFRAPRNAKTVVRLFLGQQDGLAILLANGWPLVPRSFKLAGSDATTAVLANVRTLETLGKLYESDSAIDAVLIHGRPELRGQVDLEALEKQLGATLQWHDGPALDSGTFAYGVALGCLKQNAQTFDLARIMKPRETVWELFPWGEAAVQVAVVICLGLFLMHRGKSLTERYASVRMQTESRKWLSSLADPQLDQEKAMLKQRVDAIHKFLSTRIVWSEYAHDIPSRLPENAKLDLFQAYCELEKNGRAAIKPKKSFTMRISAPFAKNGAVPEAIDRFIDSLRVDPLLKRDFPQVDLADVKWFQPFAGAKPTAFFTVACLPKSTKAAAPPGGGGEAAPKRKGH